MPHRVLVPTDLSACWGACREHGGEQENQGSDAREDWQGYTSSPRRWPIRPAVRALLLYLVVQTLVVIGVFLAVAGFFGHWDGRAVGVLTPLGEDPAVYEVVIADDEGEVLTRTMPRYAVLNMQLPVLPLGIPPETISDDLPRTRKARFQLNYLVQTRSDPASPWTWASLPTTTPQAFGLALAIWLIALGIRNMAYAGSPFWIERQTKFFLPKAQAQAGSVAQGSALRSRKAPPPAKSRRGPRR